MFSLIASDILNTNIILDDLHLTKEWRLRLLDAINNIPCKKILIVMTTPLEECLERNSKRVENRL